MNRHVAQGAAIGMAIIASVMVWVQLMVVPALQSEPNRGGLPSDHMRPPASGAVVGSASGGIEAGSGEAVLGNSAQSGSAERGPPSGAPPLFEDNATAERRRAPKPGGQASAGSDKARATADRIANELAAMVNNNAAKPEEVASLIRELRRKAPGQVADELDLGQLERRLEQAARLKAFGEKMRDLDPGKDPEDRERALALSNDLITAMVTDPAFQGVEVPQDVMVPGNGDPVVAVSPAWHLTDGPPATGTLGGEP